MLGWTWTEGNKTAYGGAPSWNFLFCDGVISNTGDTSFGATGATGELLVAAIFAQSAAIAGAHIAEVVALASFAGGVCTFR